MCDAGQEKQDKWVRSNREETILSSHIDEWSPETLAYPSLDQLSDLPSDNKIRPLIEKKMPIWCLYEVTQIGLDRQGSSFSFFPTRNEAEEAMRPDGTNFDPEGVLKPQKSDFKVGTLSAVTTLTAAGWRGGSLLMSWFMRRYMVREFMKAIPQANLFMIG